MNKPITPLRDQLIDSATDLFMRLGIKSVSMDDLAREMGVSKKTIYQEVGNKEALVELVMKCDTENDLRRIRQHEHEAHDAIDEFLRNSRYFIREMRDINPTTMRDLQKYYPGVWRATMEKHQDINNEIVARNIQRGMEEGLYRDDLDAEVIANFYVGLVSVMIDAVVFPARDRPLSEIIRHHSMYHLNGIVNQFGRERMDQYLRTETLD